MSQRAYLAIKYAANIYIATSSCLSRLRHTNCSYLRYVAFIYAAPTPIWCLMVTSSRDVDARALAAIMRAIAATPPFSRLIAGWREAAADDRLRPTLADRQWTKLAAPMD